ncbi:hypothetical protein L9F63_013723, partial [Diploptera punctata]
KYAKQMTNECVLYLRMRAGIYFFTDSNLAYEIQSQEQKKRRNSMHIFRKNSARSNMKNVIFEAKEKKMT